MFWELLLVPPVWCLSYCIYKVILYPRFFSPLRHIPGPSLGSLVAGQFPVIIQGEAGIPQREWVKKYGSVVRVVGPIGIERVIFTSPEALSKILVSDWVEYPRPSFMKNTLGLVAGFGLLTVTGNEHRLMRKTMNPAFSIPNLMAQTDAYYDAIYSLIHILRKELGVGERKVFTMYEWMSKVTLDIICVTSFGYNTDSLHNPHNELAEAYEELINMQNGPMLARFIAIVSIPGAVRLLQSNWLYERRHWLQRLKVSNLSNVGTLVDCMHRIKKISREILDEKLQDSAVSVSDISTKKDIMSLLVKARKADEEGEKGNQTSSPQTVYRMSDEMMMEQVLTFLGAGHETTASGLAWTLYLLATDLEVQQMLREEVGPLFDNDDARPDYRTMKELPWLDSVVMESLRILPPVPMTFRQAAKTDYIDGYLIPKGTIFYVPIRVVNTWTKIWGEDAEEFKPARWLNCNLPPAYTTQSFLSFIHGPHACIGKTMSLMEMKAVLAALIVNFEFTPAYEGQIPHPTAAVTMKPKDNMPLHVRRLR